MKPELRRTMHVGASPTIFMHARQLRNNPTKAEQYLWTFLRNRQMENVKFRRQHPVDDFVVDFYTHELKLSIEIDGEYHEDKIQRFADEDKNFRLRAFGHLVLRYTNKDVFDNTHLVLEDIKMNIKRLKEFKMAHEL